MSSTDFVDDTQLFRLCGIPFARVLRPFLAPREEHRSVTPLGTPVGIISVWCAEDEPRDSVTPIS